MSVSFGLGGVASKEMSDGYAYVIDDPELPRSPNGKIFDSIAIVNESFLFCASGFNM